MFMKNILAQKVYMYTLYDSANVESLVLANMSYI